MKRDTTELPTDADCYHLQDDKTLLVTKSDDVSRYTLISDKWIWESTAYDQTASSGNGTACQTLEEIKDIPSYYDFITPIYHVIAIVSAILLFYGAYKLILYPFFRIKL